VCHLTKNKKLRKKDDKKDKWMEEAQIQINLELTRRKALKEYNERHDVELKRFLSKIKSI